jgi:hypothetical protein
VTDSLQDTAPSLPDDIEALCALVLATFAERDAAVTERNILQTQNDRLRHLLLKLTRMQFGARSERLPEEQLQLGLEALEQAIAKDEAEAEKRDPERREASAAKRRANRGALPAHLPRIEMTLAPEDTACPCCRAPRFLYQYRAHARVRVLAKYSAPSFRYCVDPEECIGSAADPAPGLIPVPAGMLP